jgi:hypothetical protein
MKEIDIDRRITHRQNSSKKKIRKLPSTTPTNNLTLLFFFKTFYITK